MTLTELLPPAGTFALFLRHGPRFPIPPEDPYADVSLTPEGERATQSLRSSLVRPLVWGASSPFLRCLQTAKGLGVEPEPESRLGQPGPWVWDCDLAAALFAERGPEAVVRAQVAGEPLPGFRSAIDALCLLFACATERWEAGPGVCVSHDAILIPAMAALFGKEAAASWLEPLDGFVLWPVPGGLRARWAGGEAPC
jgi:broad specificity phosphatase PhoE